MECLKDIPGAQGAAGLENQQPVVNSAGPVFKQFPDAARTYQTSAKAERNIRPQGKAKLFKLSGRQPQVPQISTARRLSSNPSPSVHRPRLIIVLQIAGVLIGGLFARIRRSMVPIRTRSMSFRLLKISLNQSSQQKARADWRAPFFFSAARCFWLKADSPTLWEGRASSRPHRAHSPGEA